MRASVPQVSKPYTFYYRSGVYQMCDIFVSWHFLFSVIKDGIEFAKVYICTVVEYLDI